MGRVTDTPGRQPRKPQAHEVTIKTMTKLKTGWKVTYEKTIQIHPRNEEDEE